MPQTDLEYYAHWHEQELQRAAATISAEAASAHRMLAEIYLSEVIRLAGPPHRAAAPHKPRVTAVRA